MLKPIAEAVALVLAICAAVSVVYFAAKWLFFYEPVLGVILGAIFVLLLVGNAG